MTPEKLFHELLGLGLNWEVSQSRFERESGTVFLEIQERPALWESRSLPQRPVDWFPAMTIRKI